MRTYTVDFDPQRYRVQLDGDGIAHPAFLSLQGSPGIYVAGIDPDLRHENTRRLPNTCLVFDFAHTWIVRQYRRENPTMMGFAYATDSDVQIDISWRCREVARLRRTGRATRTQLSTFFNNERWSIDWTPNPDFVTF
ncbi:hypothetical protein KZZ52_35975 [Dactylosporangium sp. AC04546]|uniref:hypothetical protein n=1 Tax=Dactylosporangium sp. AC04546 TaxID=2862460 RepID=UPI001EDF5DA9|nr:hypothetical protein [Dactylosporangium sp. AC04546]WVK79367.1 hypothetical protein KZZ52_35975 [Dactylosporangium sp. AC04546]